MKVIKTIPAGEQGSLRFLDEWGDMLYAVRYRDDEDRGLILTTVEVVVDERPRMSKNRQQKGYLEARSRAAVIVRIGYHEDQVKMKAKAAGARWDPSKKHWVMSYKSAIKIGFKGRIINFRAENVNR
ncbi:MAG: hypothetical protein ACRBCS_09025 [Cellvibrionaceae bacterium]